MNKAVRSNKYADVTSTGSSQQTQQKLLLTHKNLQQQTEKDQPPNSMPRVVVVSAVQLTRE